MRRLSGMRFKLPPVDSGPRGRHGFTLLEVLAAAALLAIILVMTGSIISSSSRAWRQANAKIESFQAARAAFDAMTSRLSRGTLNTYWDYYDASGSPFRLTSNPATFLPNRYGRYSDLHFLSGPAATLVGALPPGLSAVSSQAVFFVAPTGLSADADYNGLAGLLGACGYFVAFGNDDAAKPAFPPTPSRFRWRLMEVSAPVEELTVFATPSGAAWSSAPVAGGRVRSLAENVIALIVWPRLSVQDDPEGDDISDDFAYDSRTADAWPGTPPRQPVQAHQLPPNVQITMVVIDEESAKRLDAAGTQQVKITAALNGLFDGSVLEYAADLQKLEDRLAEEKIGHRVFSTTVALRESKWSP
jgi:uncharacterized protein (TIGR02599 family)